MDITKLYTSLQEEREPFWTSLLFTVIKKPWVVVKGRPSVQLQKEMAEEEASRVQKQVEDLGKEGLGQKRKKLEAAMEENEKAPPKELLESFKVTGKMQLLRGGRTLICVCVHYHACLVCLTRFLPVIALPSTRWTAGTTATATSWASPSLG